jgi:hypothetical protein
MPVPGAGDDGVLIPVSLDTAALVTELTAINALLTASIEQAKAKSREGDKEDEKKWYEKKIALEAVGVAALAAGAAMVYALKGAAQEAIESEKNERRWVIALQLRGRVTQELLAQQREMIDAISQQTAIDDDALFNLQEQLSLRGVANEKLGEATKAVVGLSAVTGSLESATAVYSKAVDGNMKALERYGIHAKDAKDATRQLSEMYALAADNTKTFGGQLDLLGVNWGNYNQVVGDGVIKSDSAFNSLEALNKIIRDMTEFMGSDQGKGLIDAFFSAMNYGAQGAVVLLMGTLTIVDKISQAMDEVWARATDSNFTVALDESGQAETRLTALIKTLNDARITLVNAQRETDAGRSGREDEPTASPLRRTGKSREKTKEEKDAEERASLSRMYDTGTVARSTYMEGADEFQKGMEDGARARQQQEAKERSDHKKRTDALAKQSQDELLAKSNAWAAKLALEDEMSKREREIQERHLAHMIGSSQERKALLGSIANDTAQFGADIVEGLLSQEGDARAAAEKFTGAILQSMGRYLIGLGGANVVAGLWPINPASIAAGVAQLAAGAALAGTGAYVAGRPAAREQAGQAHLEEIEKSTEEQRKREQREEERVRRERDRASRGAGGVAFGTMTGPAIINNYNVNLMGFGIGSPAMFGRQVNDGIEAANRLAGGRQRIG